MLFLALEYIRRLLNSYIESVTGEADLAVLANVGRLDELPEADPQERNYISISLVNIEEEFSKKNESNDRRENGKAIYRRKTDFRNLYLLFSACQINYNEALRNLSLVLEFFAAFSKFTFSDTPLELDPTVDELFQFTEEEMDNFKLIVEPYTLTFEQINHLWGALGGKQYPFAFFKARLVAIKPNRTTGTGSVILESESRFTSS